MFNNSLDRDQKNLCSDPVSNTLPQTMIVISNLMKPYTTLNLGENFIPFKLVSLCMHGFGDPPPPHPPPLAERKDEVILK